LNGFDPVWSPDGTYITYHAWANGQPEVYIIALGGTTSTALTNNSVVDGYPAWGAQ
jgi:Tol biopolymer transport system component